jgi:hypothetical protein
MRKIIFILIFFVLSPISKGQEFTTKNLYNCEARVLKVINGDLFLGASGVFKLEDGVWKDKSDGLSKFPYYMVDNIEGFRDKIVVKTTDGIFTSPLNEFNWKHHDYVHNYLCHFLHYKGQLYLISGQGIQIYDNIKDQFIKQDDVPVKSIISVTIYRDNLYISNWKEGVFLYDWSIKQWSKVGSFSRNNQYFYNRGDTLFLDAGYKSCYLAKSDSLFWEKYNGDYLSKLIFQNSEFGINIFETRNTSDWENSTTPVIVEKDKAYKVRIPPNTYYRDIEFFKGRYYLATKSGVYVYEYPEAKDWKQQNIGVTSALTSKIYCTEDFIIVSYLSHGLKNFISFDDGVNWKSMEQEFDFPHTIDNFQATSDNTHIIADGKYYQFHNNTAAPKLIAEDYHYQSVLKLDDNKVLLGAAEGIFLTDKNGQRKKNVYEKEISSNGKISKLEMFKGKVFAFEDSKILLMSNDNGNSWQTVKTEKSRSFFLNKTKNFLYWYSPLVGFYRTSDLSTWSCISEIYDSKKLLFFLNDNIYQVDKNGYVYVFDEDIKEYKKTLEFGTGVKMLYECSGGILVKYRDSFKRFSK